MTNSSPPVKRWSYIGLGASIIFLALGVATACMPVLFSEIAEGLGLGIVQVGTVWGISSAAGIFSIPVAGFLADRFGCRRVLASFCIMAGVFGATRGLSDSFFSLVATSLLFGLASEAVPVVVIKASSQWFHGRGLGTAQGILSASVGGGMMTGAMLSATVLSPLLGGWQNVLFLYGGVTVLAGIAWFIFVPDPAQAKNTIAAPVLGRSLKHVMSHRGIWLIAIAMMAFAGSNKGMIGYLPLYLRNRGWTAASADGTLAALNAAGMVAAVPFGFISDRLGRRKSILFPGLVATVLGVGLLSVVTGPTVWFLAVLAGFFRDMIWVAATTMTVETEGIGPVYAGTAVGIVLAFSRIGYTLAPPAGNSLEVFHPGMPFVFWAGLAIVTLVAFLFVRETGRAGRGHASRI